MQANALKFQLQKRVDELKSSSQYPSKMADWARFLKGKDDDVEATAPPSEDAAAAAADAKRGDAMAAGAVLLSEKPAYRKQGCMVSRGGKTGATGKIGRGTKSAPSSSKRRVSRSRISRTGSVDHGA